MSQFIAKDVFTKRDLKPFKVIKVGKNDVVVNYGGVYSCIDLSRVDVEKTKGVWIFTRGLDEKVEDKIPKSLRSLSNFRIMNQSITPISSTEIRENYSKSKILKADECFSPKVRHAILSSIE